MVQEFSDQLMIFREDCYPHLGGGNKARKMMALHNHLQEHNYNAIVTTGGKQSNHCRATAIYCNKFGLDCTLVIHGNKHSFLSEGGNARLIREQGANIVHSDVSGISLNMNNAMERYKELGLKPYYLNGGGHTLLGARSYMTLMESLFKHANLPDYIFVPSGTGSTQAGIVAGVNKLNSKSRIVGISVGRQKHRAEKITRALYKALCAMEGILYKPEDIIIEDRYLCGGYEKFNEAIASLSFNSISRYGLFLDTTYCGKAFYGMLEIQKTLPASSTSLFWYTGGAVIS